MQGLEDLIEAAPTAMIHLRSDGSAIQINSQWSVSTGQECESALEFGWMEMLDEESREDFLKDLNDSLKNGSSISCLLYTSPSPRDRTRSRMPSSA